MPATQPPPSWYPDPQQPTRLRYWDGAAWTAHVAPAPIPVGTPGSQSTQPRKGGLPGWGIALIAVGCVGVVAIVVGILAAIVVPVYQNQRGNAAEDAATTNLYGLAQAIAVAAVDNGAEGLVVTDTERGVQIAGADGSVVQVVPHVDHARFGGYVTYNSGEWCVWVSTDDHGNMWNYASDTGLYEGSCP